MSPSERREALLGQLGYVLDEIEALRAVVHRVPEPVLAGHPLPTDRSIKEMYGLLAAADAEVFLPFAERLAAGEAPALPDLEARPAPQPWDARPMEAILDALRAARARLLDFVQALPPEAWDAGGTIAGRRCDLYGLLYHVTQHDAEWMRAAAHRLHESRLTDPPAAAPGPAGP